MAQVLTNENMVDFIQNRTVPEFKSPEAPKAEVAADAAPPEKPRDESGQFVKQDEKTEVVDKAETAKSEADAKAAGDESDDADLPERVRKQIAKKHRMMKEAEEFGRDEARRAIAAEARAEALQREIEALKAPKKSVGSDPDAGSDKEPNPEDFKTVGEYAKALTKYEVQQARKADQAKKAEDAQQQAQTKAQERLAAQVEKAREVYPDYAEVIGAAQRANWKVPEHISGYIVESDHGAKLAYHLAKDRAEFDRIAALSPARALGELGVMEKELFGKKAADKATDKPAASISKAPPPIQPLDAKTAPVVKDPKDMSFSELRAYRDGQKREGKWRAY